MRGAVPFTCDDTLHDDDAAEDTAVIRPAEDEADGYLSRQLLTYLGNKRALLGEIEQAVHRVKARLGRKQLRILDAFSGSGVVARLCKRHASTLTTIDLEDYAAVVSRCFLTNRRAVNWQELTALVEDLNRRVMDAALPPGFIEELYAPGDERSITSEDRVFYTRDNARRLDNYRRLIAAVPPQYQDLLLGPLLSEASVHANTAGVFKGFYKDKIRKVGRFGGSNADALSRILSPIMLEVPVLSHFDCESVVLQGDTNDLAPTLHDLDLVYLDPPYNQHPYGSNYFMLNLLVQYQRPQAVSRVSGIPPQWNRSSYNVRSRSLTVFQDLINRLDSRFLLVSFSNEGFIARADMMTLLQAVGRVTVVDIPYTTFRGCRNLHNRSSRVTEQLFLVERH